MTIDQVIAAQECNELAFRRCLIDRAAFDVRRVELSRAESKAMAEICARIARQTYASMSLGVAA